MDSLLRNAKWVGPNQHLSLSLSYLSFTHLHAFFGLGLDSNEDGCEANDMYKRHILSLSLKHTHTHTHNLSLSPSRLFLFNALARKSIKDITLQLQSWKTKKLRILRIT